MATARVLLLSGGYTLVSVLTTAFQPPAAPGSAAQAVVLGENVVRFQGTALSLPEITRMPGFMGTLFYNYGTLTVSNVRVDDGGRRLSPGLDGHRVRINGREYPALFDASSTKLGHWLPVPAGTETLVEILNKDNGGVSWHGTIKSDTQITANSTVHLSLAQLRASVEFDRGTAHVVIPATDTAVAVTVLTTFLCGLYLIGIAAVCSPVHDPNYTVGSLISPAQKRPVATQEPLGPKPRPELEPRGPRGQRGPAQDNAADEDAETAMLLPPSVTSVAPRDALYGLRLFLADAAANSIGVCVSGLLLSYSLLQTLRTGISLVGSVWSTAGVLYMLFTDAGRTWAASTIRMYIEVSLLSGIAVALGVYSSLAQFSAIVFCIGIVGVVLRDTLPPKKAVLNWYMDMAFRVYTLLVWAPAILAPAIYGSLIHYHNVLVSTIAATSLVLAISTLFYPAPTASQ